MIDYSSLKSILSDQVFNETEGCATRYRINSPLRLAHFLAQCAHESNGFRSATENLNYSGERLKQVFPKYFNQDLITQYERKPEAIANRVYANRMGNGSELSGDGWRYRGRGYIQLTGKDNYGKFDLIVPDNVVANPDMVATKYPLLSAAWFWDSRKLNEIADKGSTENEVAAITKKVNGGMNGIADRVEWFNKFYGLLDKQDKQ